MNNVYLTFNVLEIFQRYSVTHSNDINRKDGDDGVLGIEKMLRNISIETIEAEAIMYLAIYYRDHDDLDSAATYV